VKECLDLAVSEYRPIFQGDLQARLVRESLSELRSGRMDSFRFEHLILDVLVGLGADEARIVPRSQDIREPILLPLFLLRVLFDKF
jgi:hypothetical protein